MGHEIQKGLHTTARLRLALREPVAVQVEEVVVDPAARPRLVVFSGGRFVVFPPCAAHRVLHDEARSPVRVLHRVDEDQRLGHDEIDCRVSLGREEMVGLRHRGPAGADFVSVHAVHHRRNDRKTCDELRGFVVSKAPRVSDTLEVRLDLVQAGHALDGAEHEHDGRTAFPRLARPDQLCAVTRGG